MKSLLLFACAACRVQTEGPCQQRISHRGAMWQKQRLRLKPDRLPVVWIHTLR